MLLIVVALGAAVYGIVRLGRDLTPGQRVVLAVVGLLGIACAVLWAINAGLLGRANP